MPMARTSGAVFAIFLLTMAPTMALAQITLGWTKEAGVLCEALSDLASTSWTGGTLKVSCDSRSEWLLKSFHNGTAVGRGPDILVWDMPLTAELFQNDSLVSLYYTINATSLLKAQLYGRSRSSYSYSSSYYSTYYSRRVFGFALAADSLIMVVRDDLLALYNLSKPTTWKAVVSVTKTLKRYTGKGFTTSWCSHNEECLMNLAQVFTQIVNNTNGTLWNQSNYQIQGVLNSDATNKSATLMRALFRMGGNKTDSFTDARYKLCNGLSSIGLTFASAWANLTILCPQFGNLSFYSFQPSAQLGGYGIGINSNAKNTTIAKNFIKWLSKEETQRAWALKGALVTHTNVVQTSKFKAISKSHALFSESISNADDMEWRLPETRLLTEAQMPWIHQALTGEKSVSIALQNAALYSQAIIKKYYPCSTSRKNTTCLPSKSASVDQTLVAGVAVGCGGCVFALVGGFFLWYIPHRRKIGKLVKDAEMGMKAFTIDPSDLQLGPMIGTGAFAEVFFGVWRGTQVAVKKIRKNKITPDQMELFEKELEIMKMLRHPNILLWLGFARTQEQMIMVTEFMSNGSLATVLQNKAISLPLEMRFNMLQDVVKGMHFLHTFKPSILHRDLKSHNILIDNKFNCKVADFGLTVLSGGHKDTEMKDGAGSLFWTAPEVLRGDTYTTAADVYSFGVVFWEVITRNTPYDDLNPHYVVLKVVSDGLRPKVPESTSPVITQTIENCWKQDPMERPSFEDIQDSWPGLINLLSAEFKKEGSNTQVAPPTGKVSLVFTDIQGSTSLWEWNSELMKQSLELHNSIIRTTYQTFSGYEVKTEGDAFMIAFGETLQAVKFCAEAQLRLLSANWNPELLTQESCSPQTDSEGKMVNCGLRVRMGIHSGNPCCEIDPVACRMDYHGPDANKAARVSSIALGGMITVSKEVFAELEDNPELFEIGCFDEIGSMTLKGMASAEMIYQFIPEKLKTRNFSEPAQTHSGHPSAMLIQREVDAGDDNENKGPSWMVPFSEIEVDKTKKMGLGNFGEVFLGKWRHQNVAVKFFLNQKIDQSKVVDFRLQLREIAVLSGLRHPNILLFMCACIEQPNMCIVTEWMERGSLAKVLHSKDEIVISRSLHFAKSIAQGMAFLHASNIVHRDLKSSNVLISNNWDVKLGDFGLSKIKSTNAKMTICGTAAWTAPEVLSRSDYSFMADAYSFGIVLWEIMTRQYPFDGKFALQIPLLVIKGERPLIPTGHEFPSEYTELIEACWSHSPLERPSFNDILQRLSFF